MKNKKRILYKQDAYKKLLTGVMKTIDAISGSFGPMGGLVAIEKGKDRSPQLTNDGITIAKAIDLPCPFENLGCQILKDVGDKVNEEVGDGTTSAMILAGEIFKNGMRGIISANTNRFNIIKGVDRVFNVLISSLEKYRRELVFDDIEKIAFMSSRSDEISLLLNKAYEKIGASGLITTGESNGTESCLEIQDGAEYDIKIESSYLLDNPFETSMHHPYILVTNEKLNTVRKLVPILTKISETGRKALIVSNGCSDEVLKVLSLNKQKGGLNVSTCKLNVAIPERELTDIAALTGAMFIDGVLGIDLRELKLSDLGSADRIIIKKDKLTIINGTSKEEELGRKLQELQTGIDESPTSFDREKFSERLARLTGGIAIIRLGAHTDTALKEKKMRLEDALSSTTAAIRGGLVKGGCGVYLDLIKDLEEHEYEFVEDEKISYNIVMHSLRNIYVLLMNNSNLVGEVMLEKALNIENSKVYNIFSNQFVDFEEEGILDAYLSIQTILERSRSIVNVLLNVDALIAEASKEEK